MKSASISQGFANKAFDGEINLDSPGDSIHSSTKSRSPAGTSDPC